MDTYSKQVRSRTMAAIRGKDTRPEKFIRKLLHSSAYRYSLHKKALPGTPDIFLKRFNTAIFIHGCFWHRHKNCKYAKTPKSSKRMWNAKFKANIERDKRKVRELHKLGFRTIIIWECEMNDKNLKKLKTKLLRVLTQ